MGSMSAAGGTHAVDGGGELGQSLRLAAYTFGSREASRVNECLELAERIEVGNSKDWSYRAPSFHAVVENLPPGANLHDEDGRGGEEDAAQQAARVAREVPRIHE